jgi:hypothetical protein
LAWPPPQYIHPSGKARAGSPAELAISVRRSSRGRSSYKASDQKYREPAFAGMIKEEPRPFMLVTPIAKTRPRRAEDAAGASPSHTRARGCVAPVHPWMDHGVWCPLRMLAKQVGLHRRGTGRESHADIPTESWRKQTICRGPPVSRLQRTGSRKRLAELLGRRLSGARVLVDIVPPLGAPSPGLAEEVHVIQRRMVVLMSVSGQQMTPALLLPMCR